MFVLAVVLVTNSVTSVVTATTPDRAIVHGDGGHAPASLSGGTDGRTLRAGGLPCSGEAGSGTGAEIKDTEIVFVEDRDGDGRASKFRVKVTADTEFAETAGLGKGDPFGDIVLDGGPNGVPASKDLVRSGSTTFFLTVTWDLDIYGRTEFDSYCVRIHDRNANSPVWVDDRNTVADSIVVLTNDIKLENRENDRKAPVTIESNVNGADVIIDGDRVGTTPWTGQLPVDHTFLNGAVDVELRKDGYETVTRRLQLDPPESHTIRMQKIHKPITVTSAPSGATVFIDGEKVGKTPVSRNYWVETSHTITVKKTGFGTERRTGVSPKATVQVDLTPIDFGPDRRQPNPSEIPPPAPARIPEIPSFGPETLYEARFDSGPLLGTYDLRHDKFGPNSSAGLDGDVSNSGCCAAFKGATDDDGAGALHKDDPINTSGQKTVRVSLWVQEGATDVDGPDANDDEDLLVEYLAADGTWVTAERIEAKQADGPVTARNVTVEVSDSRAMHGGFELRLRQPSTTFTDRWYVDDLVVEGLD